MEKRAVQIARFLQPRPAEVVRKCAFVTEAAEKT